MAYWVLMAPVAYLVLNHRSEPLRPRHKSMLTPIMRKTCALAEVPEMSELLWRQRSASTLRIKLGADRPPIESVFDNVDMMTTRGMMARKRMWQH
jgi:hypothetical protein